MHESAADDGLHPEDFTEVDRHSLAADLNGPFRLPENAARRIVRANGLQRLRLGAQRSQDGPWHTAAGSAVSPLPDLNQSIRLAEGKWTQ
jgi:hypothetical protein